MIQILHKMDMRRLKSLINLRPYYLLRKEEPIIIKMKVEDK
jgi:hypothetical protein